MLDYVNGLTVSTIQGSIPDRTNLENERLGFGSRLGVLCIAPRDIFIVPVLTVLSFETTKLMIW